MVKIYKQPFAHGGDAIAIPDASQPDGKMSSADGWTPDYQLPKTDPNYRPVGRQEMNGVFKEVTESLGQVQVQGAASWSADGAPYPINAQVYHDGKQWIALRANSVAPVEGADWSAIGTAATANLTTSNTDGTAGRVLKVGDGGWMGRGASQVEPLGYPASVHDVTNQTKVIRSQVDDNGVLGYATGIHFSTAGTWGRLRVSYDSQEAWVQGGESSRGTGWTSQVVLYDNLMPSMTGSATLNGTTNNTVQLTDIVTTLGLEVGDVIRIQYSGYNKLHTVESITNNNLIRVNFEHAGNRGDGSLKLANTTASATVTRIAKWYNAPIGMGQAWVAMSAQRTSGTNYTNTTGRPIFVSLYTISIPGDNKVAWLEVNGLRIAYCDTSSNDDSQISAIVPSGDVYLVNLARYSLGTSAYWKELR